MNKDYKVYIYDGDCLKKSVLYKQKETTPENIKLEIQKRVSSNKGVYKQFTSCQTVIVEDILYNSKIVEVINPSDWL